MKDLKESTKIKINTMKFLMAAGMVYYHANAEIVFSGGRQIHSKLDQMACNVFDSTGNIGNTLFIFISAFLLFYNLGENNISGKMMRRMKSLWIPFILWNLIGLAVTDLWVPDSWEYIPLKLISSSYDGPMWFVRMLAVMVFLIPMNSKLLSGKCRGMLYIVFVIVLNHFSWFGIFAFFPKDYHIYRSLYFIPVYLLGGYIGIHKPDLLCQKYYSDRYSRIGAFIMLILSYNVQEAGIMGTIALLVRPIALWVLISEDLCLKIYRGWMKNAFFIFAIQAFVLGGFYRIARLFVNTSSSIGVVPAEAWRFCWGTLAILVCTAVATAMNRYVPKMYKILCGGRINV